MCMHRTWCTTISYCIRLSVKRLKCMCLLVAAAPLVFSTGAPTYITPRLESVSVNVTIGQVGRVQV
jgi:hypothetical protein